MTLLPSSIEGLMGLREEQAVSPSFRGLELGNESPPVGDTPTPPVLNGSGPLSHSTAHQMRDVNPNRWWERRALWKGTIALPGRGGSQFEYQCLCPPLPLRRIFLFFKK